MTYLSTKELEQKALEYFDSNDDDFIYVTADGLFFKNINLADLYQTQKPGLSIYFIDRQTKALRGPLQEAALEFINEAIITDEQGILYQIKGSKEAFFWHNSLDIEQAKTIISNNITI